MKKERVLSIEMAKNKKFHFWISSISLLIFLLLMKVSGFAQKSKLETENGMITSIAVYDADIRKDILVACQNPNILSEIKNLKDKDQKAFQNLIKTFDQKKQGWFYELTRFPDLLQKLAAEGKGLSKSEVKNMLPTQDATLEEAAWELYRNNNRDLVAVDNLNKQISDNFNQLIGGLDNNAQSAFNNLSKYPDVLNFLTNNIEMAEKVGYRYANDRNALMDELAEKHDSQILENEKEMALYKQQIEEDPDAAKELSQATQDYANDNGYILPQNRNYYVNNYYSNPYSYWFGYPTWYSSPLWYPGAYWNSFGFSYGLGGFGFYAYPSFGFSNWFYGRGYYNRYPSLYRRFGNYYNSPRSYARYGRYSGFRSAANGHYSNSRNGYNSDRRNGYSRGNAYASNNSNRNNSYGSSRGNSSSYGRNGNTSSNSSRNSSYSSRGNNNNSRNGNSNYNSDNSSSRNNSSGRINIGSLSRESSSYSRNNSGLRNSSGSNSQSSSTYGRSSQGTSNRSSGTSSSSIGRNSRNSSSNSSPSYNNRSSSSSSRSSGRISSSSPSRSSGSVRSSSGSRSSAGSGRGGSSFSGGRRH
ncbi:hypothetical protein [Lacihabitans sp. LS3-19]|uniref:hypothetical protein n=1 Tax=Lacihabitans sp. LS3-19 TaxID=2487335 RepID=UPI0020CC102B|nr:hypothetical protein [Lacihabitans sp. LS3-19]